MPRVKRSPATRSRKKKILKLAKGAFGLRKNVYRRAKETVQRALQFAYDDRRNNKRAFRSLWTVRINAAAREYGLSYSVFMHGLKKAKIQLDRKVLAELAVKEKDVFKVLTEKIKAA